MFEDESLPYVGSIMYYLPFVDGKVSFVGQPEDVVRAAKIELQTAKGDFDTSVRYYEKHAKDSRIFPTVAMCALTGAIGRRDDDFFGKVLDDLRNYHRVYAHPQAQAAAEITESLLRKRLMVVEGHPSWISDMDLPRIPQPWRPLACYLRVWLSRANGELSEVELASKILMGLAESGLDASGGTIGLDLMCGSVCQEMNRHDLARVWFDKAVKLALSNGIVLPFLGLGLGPKSALEQAIQGASPAMLRKIKSMTEGYFRNLIHFHNRYSGERLTEALSTREFYCAKALKRGASYKEIASLLSVSLGRANIMVRTIYQKLNIHNKLELGLHV